MNPETTPPSTVEPAVIKAQCRYCDESISFSAKVCHHCNRSQTWWKLQHLETASLLGLLLALLLSVLSLLEFLEARRDRVEANEALRIAKVAEEKAKLSEKLLIELRSMRQGLLIYSQDQFAETCMIFAGTYNFATATCNLPDGKMLRYKAPFPYQEFLDKEAERAVP